MCAGQQDSPLAGKFFQQFIDVNIVPTSQIDISTPIDSRKESKIFRPGFMNTVFPLIITMVAPLAVVKFILKGSYSEIPQLFLLFLPFIALGVFMGYSIFNKKLNYKILIDKNEIRIKDRSFRWGDIYESAIVYKKTNMRTYVFLLVVLNDAKKNYEIFDLSLFRELTFDGFSNRLANYIEWFKKQSRFPPASLSKQ